MLEILCELYPCWFSFPKETENKTFIGAQFQKSKYKKKNCKIGRGRPAGRVAEI